MARHDLLAFHGNDGQLKTLSQSSENGRTWRQFDEAFYDSRADVLRSRGLAPITVAGTFVFNAAPYLDSCGFWSRLDFFFMGDSAHGMRKVAWFMHRHRARFPRILASYIHNSEQPFSCLG